MQNATKVVFFVYMNETLNGFDGPAYDCPAFGDKVPCAQLLNESDALVDGNGVTNAEKIAHCVATLKVASEADLPLQSCGYQKFSRATPDVQVRIRRIMDTMGNTES